MNALKIENISFAYNEEKQVLDNISYNFEENKSYAIIGKSGSGKTTLISLLSGLERVKQGTISYFEQPMNDLNLDQYRSQKVGIIFQSYNLLNNYSVMDNILMAMKISKQPVSSKRVFELLELVGLEKGMAAKRPLELSGGQQQRVAIARTLAKNTKIIIADEPTGNLDEATEKEILVILQNLVKTEDKTLIIVTHSNYVANNCDEVVGINNGKLNPIK